MTAIDPIRRAARLRKAQRPDPDTFEEQLEAPEATLPVPAGSAYAAPPEPEPPPAAATFGAQLLGQDGEKRGLRAGPAHIEGAAQSYNRAHWSGSRDRRARKGGITKTEI
jgi:hypothetical protein